MALELLENSEYFESNKDGDLGSVDPWDEESPRDELVDSINHTLLNPKSKIHENGVFSKRKPVCVIGNESAQDGVHRSITDLPTALVSEILHRLNPKELGVISCVSTLLNSIASDHHGWKEFYRERWGLPLDVSCSHTRDHGSWKKLFIERDHQSNSFMGRYRMEVLHGHTETVRAVFLLPDLKLLFTGGYDSVIRMWDLVEALSLAVSRPFGCTIRAITADTKLLVAGGTDAFLQCWRAIEGHPHLFDISGVSGILNSEFRLWGHEGPVTCLALDSNRIYSGSWDMSVRIWERSHLKCSKILRHGDWVWALSPRGSTVVSTAGRDIYLWSAGSGEILNIFYNSHIGNAQALARSHNGNLLFTAGEDGAVRMFQIVAEKIKPSVTWIPHTSLVHSIAFEFPWVVSSSNDGRLALIDVRKLLRSGGLCSLSRHGSKVTRCVSVEPPQRMLQGFGSNLFSVSIGADRIVCSSEDGVVRMWDFSRALEIEKRTQALRSARMENRMRRRKAQIEMNGGWGHMDQCAATAKRNLLNSDRGGVWHSKRETGGKLRA